MQRTLVRILCVLLIPLLIAAGAALMAWGWYLVDSIFGPMSVENGRLLARGLLAGVFGAGLLAIAHALYVRTQKRRHE